MPMTKQQLLKFLDNYPEDGEIKIMISRGQLENIECGDNNPVQEGDKMLYCLDLDSKNVFSYPSLSLVVDCYDMDDEQDYDSLVISLVSSCNGEPGLSESAQRLQAMASSGSDPG